MLVDDTTYNLVHEWLNDHGFGTSQLSYSPAKDWIKLKIPMSALEQMLDTSYSIFQHEHGHKVVRTTSWSLPKHLTSYIDLIKPTTAFFGDLPASVVTVPQIPDPLAARATQTDNQNQLLTPNCLRTLYGTSEYVPTSSHRDLIGIANFFDEPCNISDISLFIEEYRPDIYPALKRGSFIKSQLVNGGVDNQRPSTPEELAEKKGQLGNLMAETILGITGLIPLTVYSTGGISPVFVPDANYPDNFNIPWCKQDHAAGFPWYLQRKADLNLVTWTQYIISQPNPPLVIAVGYSDEEQTIPKNYARRTCGNFMALGARGVSLLFSSGSDGVGLGKPARS